jgi:spermidine synthase
MGTTFRSSVSWDVKTIAVELVPSVRDAFGFYFDDAEAISKTSNAKIVIDDARRFLKRTLEKFDVITIDPPPPICAAGSSLLYSEEFYEILKNRLNKGGIVQQWSPGGEKLTQQAMLNAICSAFSFVRVFHSIEGTGFHFFASMQPLNMPTANTFLARLPEAAARDFVEWSEGKSAGAIYDKLLLGEIPLSKFLSAHMNDSITDDRPLNEYFLLRRFYNILRNKDQQLF